MELNFPNAARIPHEDNFEDLIQKLLAHDPADRLGSNGGHEEILSHPWFNGIDRA